MSTAEHRHGAIRKTPDRCGAFPRLTPEQLQDLTGHGERRRTTEGEVLYREGEPFQEFGQGGVRYRRGARGGVR